MTEIKNVAKTVGFMVAGWLAATGADAMWKGSEPLPDFKVLIAMAVGMVIGLGMRWNRHRHKRGDL